MREMNGKFTSGTQGLSEEGRDWALLMTFFMVTTILAPNNHKNRVIEENNYLAHYVLQVNGKNVKAIVRSFCRTHEEWQENVKK